MKRITKITTVMQLSVTDKEIWEDTRALADAKDISLSKLVQSALEYYISSQDLAMKLKIFIRRMT